MAFITSSGLNPRTFATSTGFYISGFRLLIWERPPHYLYDHAILANPRQTGTHRWHTTEENGVLVALNPIYLPDTCQGTSRNRFSWDRGRAKRGLYSFTPETLGKVPSRAAQFTDGPLLRFSIRHSSTISGCGRTASTVIRQSNHTTMVTMVPHRESRCRQGLSWDTETPLRIKRRGGEPRKPQHPTTLRSLAFSLFLSPLSQVL